MNFSPLQLHRLVLVLALMLLLGCAAKKQAGPTQPPVQAPAAAATPEATPEAAPSPSATPAQQSQLPAQGTPPPEPEQTPAANTNKTANGKQHSGKKSSTGTRETAKNSAPKTTVVPADAEPPTSGGTISPGGISTSTPNEPSTDQLLQSTENSLNGLNRQLSSDEQVMVMQIRDFINQSRQATKDNDGVRAHNLAVKAHLLCDDLMKHR